MPAYKKYKTSILNFMSSKQFIRHTWKGEEDERLRELVLQMGEKRWQAVSQILVREFQISSINGKACRERYKNHLADNVNKSQWTKKEVDILFTLYTIHGARWSEIAHSLPGRTDNGIKNYFYATLRRSLRRMLKALGKHKSSSELGKVKPHVLTQLFGMSDEDLTGRLKEISTIVHDVVVTFAEDKHQSLTEEQYVNYSQVLNKLQQLNHHYLLEKQAQKEEQKKKERELDKYKKQKIIYKIKKYIFDTEVSKNILERVKLRQKVFKQVHRPRRCSDDCLRTFKEVPHQNKMIKKEETDEQNDLQFVQPSQMPSYNLHQFAEQIASQKSDMFVSLLPKPRPRYLPMDSLPQACFEPFQSNQRLPWSGINLSSESNLHPSLSNKSLIQMFENMMQQRAESKEVGDAQFAQIQQLTSAHNIQQQLSFNEFLLEKLMSQRNEQGLVLNPFFPIPLESHFSQLPQQLIEQLNSQYNLRLPLQIPSFDSNVGTQGESIRAESQQFTDYAVTARKPDPLKGLQKMQSDQL